MCTGESSTVWVRLWDWITCTLPQCLFTSNILQDKINMDNSSHKEPNQFIHRLVFQRYKSKKAQAWGMAQQTLYDCYLGTDDWENVIYKRARCGSSWPAAVLPHLMQTQHLHTHTWDVCYFVFHLITWFVDCLLTHSDRSSIWILT